MEDFIAALPKAAAGHSQFFGWYEQAGTPLVAFTAIMMLRNGNTGCMLRRPLRRRRGSRARHRL